MPNPSQGELVARICDREQFPRACKSVINGDLVVNLDTRSGIRGQRGHLTGKDTSAGKLSPPQGTSDQGMLLTTFGMDEPELKIIDVSLQLRKSSQTPPRGALHRDSLGRGYVMRSAESKRHSR